MGGGGSSGGTSTTTQSIPGELKPLATAYTDKAIGLSSQTFQPYTGQRYTDMNTTQQAGVDMITDRAQNGSQTFDNAEGNLNQMMSGGANPYLDQMVGKAQDSVIKGYNQANNGSGSFGNSGLQEALTKGLGDVSTQMYGQAYDGDQSRRLSAISAAPTFANQAYADSEQLMKVGQFTQDQDQQSKDFAYEQFMEQQNLPYKQLGAMSGVFGSNLGASSTTQQSGGGGGK